MENLGEFAAATISRALGKWDAITAPVGVTLRLAALFPYAELLCPPVQMEGREGSLAAAPLSRRDLESAEGVDLGRGSFEAARVLCEHTAGAANELLRQPETLIEFEW